VREVCRSKVTIPIALTFQVTSTFPTESVGTFVKGLFQRTLLFLFFSNARVLIRVFSL
jgi:hypothetical protein